MVKKILYIVFSDLFKNYQTKYLPLMVKIFITLLLINFMWGSWVYSNSMLNIAESFNSRGYSIRTPVLHEKYIFETISELPGVKNTGTFLRYPGKISNDKEIEYQMYSEGLIENTKFPLSSGRWFKENETEINTDEIIPVVISSTMADKYKLNDKIKVNIADIDLQVKVIGILNKHNFHLDFSSWRHNRSRVRELVSREDKKFMISPHLEKIKQEMNYTPVRNGLFLFPESDYSNIELWKKRLGAGVHFLPLSTIIDNEREHVRNLLLTLIPYALLLILMTLIGIGGYNALIMYSNEKTYALRFLCGATKRITLIIYGLKIFFIMMIPGIIACWPLCLLQYKFWGNIPFIGIIITEMISKEILIDFTIYPFALLMVTIIFILSSGGPLYSLYKTTPVSIIRRWE